MTDPQNACKGLPAPDAKSAGKYPDHLIQIWTLASGEALCLRPIRPDDGEREEAFVRGLSRDTGYQRMLSAFKLTPEFVERMTHIDYRCHMAFVVTAMKDGNEHFVGIGRYVVGATAPTAEFGLVVADDRQHQGLGRRLLQALIEHAQEAGVRELVGVVLATNRAMLSLARSLGFTISREPDDATVLNVRRQIAPERQQGGDS